MKEYKKDEISKFSFAYGEKITSVDDCDFQYIEESSFGVCPECGAQLGKKQIFRIIKLISIKSGKHYVGLSEQGHTLKIPNESIPKELMK